MTTFSKLLLYPAGEPNHFTGEPSRYHAILFEYTPGQPPRYHDLLTHASESDAHAYADRYKAAIRRLRGEDAPAVAVEGRQAA